jgi:PAS domain S-box-containing protein
MDKWLEALGDAADGALVIDQEQRILFCNQAAKQIIGHNGDEVTGSFCYATLAGRSNRGLPLCRENCRCAAAAAKGLPVESFDLAVNCKSAGIRWLNMSTVTLPSNGTGQGARILHLFRDVTERKQRGQLLDRVLEAAEGLQDGRRAVTFAPQPASGPVVELTDREQEVLSLLAEGTDTGGIAQTLVISPSTVRNHIRNILDKFQVHSRLEAVLYALRHGLVTLDQRAGPGR